MFSGLFAFIGRILLALMFIVSGFRRLFQVDEGDGYIAEIGLPANLLTPVGVFELVGGLMIALGIFTRVTSFLFAAFCLFAALLLQREVSDPMRVAETLKYVAIAGGFLCLLGYEGKSWSFDHYRARRRAEAARQPTIHPGVGAG